VVSHDVSALGDGTDNADSSIGKEDEVGVTVDYDLELRGILGKDVDELVYTHDCS
jgi:hypothetical protein